MAKKPRRSEIMRARRTFTTQMGGFMCTVVEGELAHADHEIVTNCPDQWEPAHDRVRFVVEQATANPGEARGEET